MIIGERQDRSNIASAYSKNPLRGFVESYMNTVDAIREQTSYDFVTESAKTLRNRSAYDALKQAFIEESYDPNLPQSEIEDHIITMEAQFENDKEAVMAESANMAAYNPVIGLTFPMHKFILMNMVFDKGAIPKFVAQSPKFTLTMEYRILVDPEGNEIDMFKEQNKMTEAMEKTAPLVEWDVDLSSGPLTDDVEIVHTRLGGTAGVDHMSIETNVCAVKIKDVYFEVGDILPDPTTGYIEMNGKRAESAKKQDVWVRIKGNFVPTYGDNGRVLTYNLCYRCKTNDGSTTTVTDIKDLLTGTFKNDRLIVQCLHGKVAAIRLQSRLDTSNARRSTCTVKWKEVTDIVEIPNAIPINTTISPEEVKDVNAMYSINQVTKLMAMMKTVLGNYKDDKIKENLDISYQRLDDADKMYAQFDMAPRMGYSGDHMEWRKATFFEFIEYQITGMLQVLNDPNMTITIFGSPQMVRMITPTDFQYQTPSNIGPVDLDYQKTVVSSNNRVYQFIGSDKLRDTTEFIIVLTPRGTDRIIYRIYDYQMYISNEIRNFDNPALPAIHAFERWKFVEYQPIQGRLKILNPLGLVPETYNYIPVSADDVNVAGRETTTTRVFG